MILWIEEIMEYDGRLSWKQVPKEIGETQCTNLIIPKLLR
jgi:hypothetical protein